MGEFLHWPYVMVSEFLQWLCVISLCYVYITNIMHRFIYSIYGFADDVQICMVIVPLMVVC